MRKLVAAEVRKLTTTRSTYLLLVGVVAMALVSVFDPERTAATFAKPFHEQTFVFFTALLTRMLVLVMGIRAITDELRYGTIVSTLVVSPGRGRLIAAKAVTVGGTGALLAVTGWAAMVGGASALAAMDGTALSLGGDAWRSLAGTVFSGVAWGLIGLGLGALVRNQLVATVGGLVWLMGLEDAIRGWLGDLAMYLPGQSGLALTIGSSGRALAVGAATMAAYALAATLAGAAAMRRDVT